MAQRPWTTYCQTVPTSAQEAEPDNAPAYFALHGLDDRQLLTHDVARTLRPASATNTYNYELQPSYHAFVSTSDLGQSASNVQLHPNPNLPAYTAYPPSRIAIASRPGSLHADFQSQSDATMSEDFASQLLAAGDLRPPPPPAKIRRVKHARAERCRSPASSEHRRHQISMQSVITPSAQPPSAVSTRNEPPYPSEGSQSCPATSIIAVEADNAASERSGRKERMAGMMSKFRVDPFAEKVSGQHVVFHHPVEVPPAPRPRDDDEPLSRVAAKRPLFRRDVDSVNLSGSSASRLPCGSCEFGECSAPSRPCEPSVVRRFERFDGGLPHDKYCGDIPQFRHGTKHQQTDQREDQSDLAATAPALNTMGSCLGGDLNILSHSHAHSNPGEPALIMDRDRPGSAISSTSSYAPTGSGESELTPSPISSPFHHIHHHPPPTQPATHHAIPPTMLQSASAPMSNDTKPGATAGGPVSSTTGAVQGDDKPKKKVKKVKMHPCSICGKEFPRPSGLQTHMNVHSGARPFRCPVQGCEKAFGVRSNATRHLRVHQRAREHAELQAARVATNGFSIEWLHSLPEHHQAHQHHHHLPAPRPTTSSSVASTYTSSSVSSDSAHRYLTMEDVGQMQLLGGQPMQDTMFRATPADALQQQQQPQQQQSPMSASSTYSYGQHYPHAVSNSQPQPQHRSSFSSSPALSVYPSQQQHHVSYSSPNPPAAQVATSASTAARVSGSYSLNGSSSHQRPPLQHSSSYTAPPPQSQATSSHSHLYGHSQSSSYRWVPDSLLRMSNAHSLSWSAVRPRAEASTPAIAPSNPSEQAEWPYHPTQWKEHSVLPGRASSLAWVGA